MYAFDYHRPETLSDAVADLANPDAKALAGGMTLLPTMKQRLASPTALIDLKNVPELAGVTREGDNLVIGAMTRHADVAHSRVVQAAIPALASLAGVIGDPACPQHGHDRRVGGQQRSSRRLSGRGAGARRHDRHQQAPHRRDRIFSPACSRRRSRLANSSPRSAFRCPKEPRTEVPQPGVALRAGRRLRRQDGWRRSRRGDRRRLERRLSRRGVRSGVERRISRPPRSMASRCLRAASIRISTPTPTIARTSSA